MKFRGRWKKLSILLLAMLATLIVLQFPSPLKDYARLKQLHQRYEQLVPGMPVSQIADLLGQPDDFANGSATDVNGNKINTTAWEYRTHYDWDGIRTRWNHQSFIPYWISRVSPIKEWSLDDVLSIHVADGILIEKYREDDDNGLLFRTR